ncbi:MAG: radical SAM protein [Clostridiales bacterium]|nr:radical SAM protein [Clostridiales bacterium]
MHFTKAKGILSANNGMNVYRGCSHGCIYCDSRSRCYGFTHEFEDIEVKSNALELLEDALRRKRKKCMIGTGAMTDPYIPLESKLKFTRGAMELVYKYGFGMTVQTKSDRILRDLDLICKINEKTKFVVQTTLTTADETLCKKIEPNVSTTSERVEMLKTFQSHGVPTIVWLCPILPFINDTEQNINDIVDYCAATGVYGIINFGMGLTLREGNREYFYEQLDKLFPGLKEKYIKTYGDKYEVPSPNAARLQVLFVKRCKEAGIICDNDKLFAYLHEFPQGQQFEQLKLF